MIVREIVRPELTDTVIAQFDYFNDYTDTFAFLVEVQNNPKYQDQIPTIVAKLDEGWKIYCKQRGWAEHDAVAHYRKYLPSKNS